MHETKADRIRRWREHGFDASNCPVRELMGHITSKWSVLILIELETGTMRFNALLRALPDMSRKMLTQNLRELEQDRIVMRRVFDTRPPRVEYSLTHEGRALMKPLLSLIDWLSAHSEATSGEASAPASRLDTP